ncbi:MAG: CPXCG motif-containing cysteine-rich protein [Gemmatimonadaceae bacterium]
MALTLGNRPQMRLPDEKDLLDSNFPLGDGTAETEATVYCPYCNENVEIALDPGGGPAQEYVEDCEVCCQPWNVSVRYRADGTATVIVTALD